MSSITQFHLLTLNDLFRFEPKNWKWQFVKEEESKEIDTTLPFEKQLAQFTVRLRRETKQSITIGPGKWIKVPFKERRIIYEKIEEKRYKPTLLGDKHELYYPGTKNPIIYDMLIPFIFVEKITNELCEKNQSI